MTNPGDQPGQSPAAGYPPPNYPPPQYGTPQPGYSPPTTRPGNNSKAVASLVTSILGWVCFAPLAIVGLILGVMAMRETKRTGQAGHGMALAGTIISGLFVVAAVILIPVYFFVIASQ